jgi:hypothetical protein
MELLSHVTDKLSRFLVSLELAFCLKFVLRQGKFDVLLTVHHGVQVAVEPQPARSQQTSYARNYTL